MSAADIHFQITEVYGNEAMRYIKERKWVRKFKDGHGQRVMNRNCYTNAKWMDVHFFYGLAYGNGCAAVRL
ncbi:hypothetical protein TNCV_44541 [Trichonephila clavipes]|nr:hypothetical protein TNCV_44541 [Trichonephila clavipes]